MKKQICLLLIAVALNLSNGVQASAYLPRATRQAVPLISRYAVRPGELSQGVLQYARQPIQQQFAQPGLTIPAMRTFATKTPEIVARPQYSYWQQLKDSPTARRIAGLLAGGTLIGTGSALAQEENQPEQKSWFERWFGKPRGYSAGKLQEDLSKALEWGVYSPDRVRDLIAKGVDVNAATRSWHKITPLMDAVTLRYPDSARELIKAGADVNAKDIYEHTPLMYAVGMVYDAGPPDTVRELINAGADVNAKNKEGKTALMSARDPESVRELIKAGADVNAKDETGGTALSYAVGRGELESVRELINAGADVNAKRVLEFAQLLRLYQSGHPETAEIIELLKSSGTKEHSDSWTEWKEWTCKKLGIL